MAPAGNPAAPPASIHVECERDIVDAVCRARERKGTVRPVGAKGSKNDCYCAEDVALEFDRYDRVTVFDGTSVTVQAGMKVGRLNEFLRARGVAVPTCGEWQGATVAGSIATGSHGGSSRHGIHSSSVKSLRIVTGDGAVKDIDREDPLFRHVAVSMGTLGVISTATLACVDAFHLELETRVVPFAAYLREHRRLNEAAEFFAAVWFPAAGKVLTFAANRVAPQPETGPRMERFSVRTFLLDAASRLFSVDAVSAQSLEHRWVDHADRILCPIPDASRKIRALRRISRDWKAMEAAVPLARATEALAAFERLLRSHRATMLNAVGLRSSPADSFSLSPCHDRDTFWIDLFYQGRDGSFTEALALAIEGMDGRCHWGKHVGLPMDHLKAQYPSLADFRQARAALDPGGTFASPFSRRIGL